MSGRLPGSPKNYPAMHLFLSEDRTHAYRRRWKCADIPTENFLRVVWHLATDGKWGRPYRWVNWGEVAESFPRVPPKVVHAKFRRLYRKGLLMGCTCGCRGDITLTDAGAGLIGVELDEDYKLLRW